MEGTIMKMKHVTISTAKLQESVNFYETFCGLTVQRRLENPGHNIVFLANGEGETCIELIEAPDAAFKGTGISIGFEVEDVPAYHKAMEDKGFNPTPIFSPNPHVKFFFVEDPNGVEIQFI
jgi:lactoylglutathione lyase